MMFIVCDQGLKELPELKLLSQVESLKNSQDQHTSTQVDYIFRINEINEQHEHTSNLILYNINKSDSKPI